MLPNMPMCPEIQPFLGNLWLLSVSSNGFPICFVLGFFAFLNPCGPERARSFCRDARDKVIYVSQLGSEGQDWNHTAIHRHPPPTPAAPGSRCPLALLKGHTPGERDRLLGWRE